MKTTLRLLAVAFTFLATCTLHAEIGEIWVTRYNGPINSTDHALATAVDSAGNVIVTGYSQNTGSGFDYYTAKYAASTGVLLWEKRYNGTGNNFDAAFSVAVDSGDNVIVTGYSDGGAANGADYYTAKYAAATGAVLWEVRYNGLGSGDDRATSVQVDSAGNVVVTGQSTGTSSSWDYYTAKYAAADGALLWEQRYNGTGNGLDFAASVAVDGSGNVAVTGRSRNASANQDYYTAKYAAADGALMWEQRYNSPGDDQDIARSVAMDGSGNVIVTGSSRLSGTNDDIYTVKYAAVGGGVMWEKRYDGPGATRDDGYGVAVDGSGNVIVTGGANFDFYTAKYEATTGALAWEKRYNGPGASADVANSVAVNGAGDVFVTGQSFGSGTGNDFYTAKYAAADGALVWEQRYAGPDDDYAVFEDGTTGGKLALTPDGGVVVTGGSSNVANTLNGPNLDYATVKYGVLPSDADGDGIDSADEDVNGNGNVLDEDTDGDGTADYLDDDDDNDGVPTIDELPTSKDTDGDGIPNYRDDDDDEDGIPTVMEDVNGNGTVLDDDSEGDGIVDYLDQDDDNDGVLTKDEDLNANGNYLDDDDDGDGTPDYLDGDAVVVDPTHTARFKKGAAVPGAGVDAYIPAGATWFSFGVPAINGQGKLAYIGKWKNAPGSAMGTYGTGLFVDGVLKVSLGQGATLLPGATFKAFKDPVIAADSAAIAFPATLAGTGVLPANDTSLWWQPASGTLTLLAREGTAAVGGGTWKGFASLALPGGATGPIFVGSLVQGTDGIDATKDMGVWAVDSTGALRLLFREGDAIDGGVVKSFVLLKAVPGSPGASRAFNSAAEITWRATFTDGSSALMVTAVP